MPRRKPTQHRKLTVVEMMILLAIGAIFLSILVPAVKQKQRQARQERRPPSVGLTTEAYHRGRSESAPGGGATLFLVGFAVGVGATLLYQRKRTKTVPAARAKSVEPAMEDRTDVQ